jgi:hypothetical protein
MQFNYEGRVFRSLSNSSNGEVGSETSFHYHQRENIVWAMYDGGRVLMGTLLAKVNPDGFAGYALPAPKSCGRLHDRPMPLDS